MSAWVVVSPVDRLLPSYFSSLDFSFCSTDSYDDFEDMGYGIPTNYPDSKARELAWQLNELGDELRALKLSLDDCYNLLGSDGRGNTLVVSTPRNEVVKGHITRLGTRIVKGTIHLRLRTLSPQTLTIDPDHPITIAPLENLQTLLTRSIDLLDLTLGYAYPLTADASKHDLPPLHQQPIEIFLEAQLRVLFQALQDAAALLRGPPLSAADPLWTTQSAGLAHFTPELPPNISFYIGLQDSQLVLWLRALEPTAAPINLGMKFALALGTARRLEHDEADQIFRYYCEDRTTKGLEDSRPPATFSSEQEWGTGPNDTHPDGPVDIFVREKIRVESADPSLLSLSAKVNALSHTLLLARINLAAVMGEELDD